MQTGATDEAIIQEMNEDDWISPEDRRLEEEKRAREEAVKQRIAAANAAAVAAAVAASNAANKKKEHSAAPGQSQLQTTISDVFLALACYGAMRAVSDKSELAWMGFATIALAAMCGAVRFTGFAHRVAIPVHDALSALATFTAMPLICLSCFALPAFSFLNVGLFILDLFLLAVHVFLPSIAKFLGNTLGLASGLLIVFQAIFVLFSWGPYALPCSGFLLAGVGIAVIAGEFLKPKRKNYIVWGSQWLGVDVFHFLFGIAVVSLGYGIRFRLYNVSSSL